jgi:hypothetical protein
VQHDSTLAAVTLRIYIPLFDLAGLPEIPAYRAISFLCWVPNLVAAELIIRVRRVSAASADAGPLSAR